MKATEAKLIDFLRRSPQFVIPIYQRTYSWTATECRQLWDDVVRAGADEAVSAHFVGSIVYVEQGLSQVTNYSPLLVIDGQQRLTTVTLLLAALAKALDALPEAENEPFDGFSPRKLRNYYLLNPEEQGERRFKLLLSQTDKTSLIAIVDGRPQPAEPSIRVAANFKHFTSLIEGLDGDLVPLCRGLAKLVIVDIALNRDQDNPQLIFESMNSTGRELSQADLIRNFILMGLDPQLQTRLYEDYWRPMERDVGQEAYGTHFDAFMRHYLTLKTGDIPNVNAVYDAFKAHARSPATAAAGVEALVRDIRDFGHYFCAMAFGAEKDAALRQAFHDLRELRVDVAYPFLLELYHDHVAGVLPRDDFLRAIRLVEAYVFRRTVSAIPTNSLNKTFATFTKALRKDRYVESIAAHLMLLPSYRRFPGDEEFKRELVTRDLYNVPRKSYWLRRLENHRRKEPVAVDEYTIEHIMPQNPNLPQAWRIALGADWERVQQTWLHTLGNLTLTAYNADYSDRPFAEKRDLAERGLKFSPLHVNEGLGHVEAWDEQAIRTRAARLAARAAEVWPAPALAADVLNAYRPRPVAQYGIEDHVQLNGGQTRALFEAFRKEVLALDPGVTEEFLKLYVAYKLETNFVDVVPQAKRLRLTINMPFAEVDDPKGVCKDVSGVGRWGNGEVEAYVARVDELPYILSLVRQALDRQMEPGTPA